MRIHITATAYIVHLGKAKLTFPCSEGWDYSKVQEALRALPPANSEGRAADLAGPR